MSSSATIYRISAEKFRELEVLNSSSQDLSFSSICKDYEIFEQSYLGLEFILIKCIGEEQNEIIQEIFNPIQHIGGGEEVTPEEFERRIMAGDADFLINDPIFYLPPEKVKSLGPFIKSISIDDIRKHYNADELNKNGIYPYVWHNDKKPDRAFNVRHLTEDLHNLKSIVEKAVSDNDYLITMIV